MPDKKLIHYGSEHHWNRWPFGLCNLRIPLFFGSKRGGGGEQ